MQMGRTKKRLAHLYSTRREGVDLAVYKKSFTAGLYLSRLAVNPDTQT